MVTAQLLLFYFFLQMVSLTKIIDEITQTSCTEYEERYWLREWNMTSSTLELHMMDSKICRSEEVCFMENCTLKELLDNVLFGNLKLLSNSDLKYIIQKQKVELNKPLIINGFNTTIVNFAIKRNYTVFVEEVINLKPDIYKEDSTGNTTLHNAIINKNIPIVQLILKQNTSGINKLNNNNETALFIAVSIDNIEIVRELLSVNADPYTRNANNETTLHIAAAPGRLMVLREILNKTTAGIDMQAKGGFTALYNAVKYNNLEACKLLLTSGASPYVSNQQGFTPLHSAANHGRLRIVKLLLKYSTIGINYRTKKGSTAFLLAAKLNYTKTCKSLLENGADPNIPDFKRRTALHEAALRGLLKLVELIINETKVKIDFQDNKGATPLFLSASNNNTKVCELLLSAGANPEMSDIAGNTPIHIAAKNGHLTTVRVIAGRYPAVIDKTNLEGETAIYLATDKNHSDVVMALITQGADLTISTNDGWTPLHKSIKNQNPGIVKELLNSKKINVNAESSLGNSPLQQAVWANRNDLFHLLIDNGAKPITDILWRTLLHDAATHANIYIIDVMLSNFSIPINTLDFYGFTPLIRAVINDHVEVARYLIEKGADTTFTDHTGRNILHIAMAWSSPEMILLITNYTGSNLINTFNDYGETPIMVAIDNNASTLETILGINSDLFIFASGYDTPLHMAAKHNNTHHVHLILTKFPKIIDHLGEGYTALQMAANSPHYCHSTIIAYLLKNNANPTILGNHGENIFHRVAGVCPPTTLEEIYFKTVEFEAKTGKSDDFVLKFINKVNMVGRTPLFLAAYHSNVDGFLYLFNKGGYTRLTDAFGCSVLVAAAHGGNTTIINFILKNTNLSVDDQCNDGRTPLMVAAEKGKIEAFDYLLAKGANLDAVTKFGDTLLHYAMIYKDFPPNLLYKILNRTGTNIDARNAECYTPLMRAVQNGNHIGVKFLLENNADPSIENLYQENAVILGAREGNSRILNLLNYTSYNPEMLLGVLIGRQLSEPITYSLRENLLNRSSIAKYPLFYAAATNNFNVIDNLVNVISTRKVSKFPILMKEILQDYHNAMSHLLSEDKDEQINFTHLTPLDISLLFSRHMNCVKTLVQKLKYECTSLNYRRGLWTTMDFAMFTSGWRNSFTNFANGYFLDLCKCCLSQPTNEHHWTLAHKAAWMGDAHTIKALHRLGVDIHMPDKFGRTPLHIASLRGAFLTVRKILLLSKKSINSKDIYGFTPLHLTQVYRNEKFFLRMSTSTVTLPLEKKFRLIQQSTSSGSQWEHKMDHLTTFQILTRNGANLDVQDRAFGWTALHWAAAADNLETVAQLVVNGARVNVDSWTKETAMMVARSWGRQNVYSYLKSRNGVW